MINIISGKYQLYAWIAGVTGLVGITVFSLWVIHCFMSNHKCQKECASPIATLISWRLDFGFTKLHVPFFQVLNE